MKSRFGSAKTFLLFLTCFDVIVNGQNIIRPCHVIVVSNWAMLY